jgi:hypothetical protein
MNHQQELLEEKKEKEELLKRVSLLEEEVKSLSNEMIVVQEHIVQLINVGRKLR